MITAYLAGPDVFLPDAAAHLARKVAICRRRGIEGLSPLDASLSRWEDIFRRNEALMARSDIAIANLTPFRGASADAGTLVELGWFFGRGRPVFAYSNDAAPFARRAHAQRAAVPDPMTGLGVEEFGLWDNLMIPGAIAASGGAVLLPEAASDGAPARLPFASLALFERCVEEAARRSAAGR